MAKKKNPTVVRTTITVPWKLKERMDKAGEPVNWSALACLAFEQKLGEIASRKEKKTMDDVIARLRESKRKTDNEAQREGFDAGAQWAKNYAEAMELERLAEVVDRYRSEPAYDWDWFLASDGNNAFGPHEHLACQVLGEDRPTRQDASDFWENALGDDADRVSDPEFLRGFVDGALDIWAEVKKHL